MSADQLVVALQLDHSTNDQAAFVPWCTPPGRPLIDCISSPAVPSMCRHRARRCRHASDANLAAPDPDRLIALGKGRDQAKSARACASPLPAADATPRDRMLHRLATEDGARLYRRQSHPGDHTASASGRISQQAP